MTYSSGVVVHKGLEHLASQIFLPRATQFSAKIDGVLTLHRVRVLIFMTRQRQVIFRYALLSILFFWDDSTHLFTKRFNLSLIQDSYSVTAVTLKALKLFHGVPSKPHVIENVFIHHKGCGWATLIIQ